MRRARRSVVVLVFGKENHFETYRKPSTSRVVTASRRFKFTRHNPRSLLPHGVSLGCPPLAQRPSALQDVCASTHDIGSQLVSLYDPAHHLASWGSIVAAAACIAAPAVALAAPALALAATNTPITAFAAQMCGRLQPRLGH